MTRAPEQEQARGDVRISWRRPGILLVRFEGHATGEVVQAALRGSAEALRERSGTLEAVIVDTSALTGFDAAVSAPGRAFLQLFVDHRAKLVASISPSSAVRMLGSALSLATGARLRFFADDAEAEAAIATALAKR